MISHQKLEARKKDNTYEGIKGEGRETKTFPDKKKSESSLPIYLSYRKS